LDINIYTTLIKQNFPQLTIQTIKPITKGWDSVVLVINDAFIFRFPMRDDVAEPLAREIRLLPRLEPTLSTPIPHFEFLGHGNADYLYTFVGYRMIGGLALDDPSIPHEQLPLLVPHLATFLNELHGFSVEQAVHLGVEEHTPALWRDTYRERYLDLQKRVFPLLDVELRTKSEQLWESFLDNSTHFAFQPRLIHCDLVCEHIFCDPERGVLTGVIDWGDVTIGDTAIDFVGPHWTYGREFTEQILMRYQHPIDESFWQRMNFYLSYSPYAQLLYGSYSEDETFIRQGIEGLRTLFSI
jgi:aminoglycoside 2''-phosphotransferase